MRGAAGGFDPIQPLAKRVIRESATDHQGGMMMQSGHSTSTYIIVGGVVMAAMMAAMLIRGGMY